ncbi:hypothetical protein EDB80DRAFT_690933 [Ilyonectria destructans]|nr:hypothetical protein EDB80DRAFT_690933 [Ilyonectria destructans]
MHKESASKFRCTCGIIIPPTPLAGDPLIATLPSTQTSLGKQSSTGDNSNFAGPLKRTRIDDGGVSERTVDTCDGGEDGEDPVKGGRPQDLMQDLTQDQPQDAQPQDAQPQGAQPQGAQPQGAQPQGAQPQDAQPQDAQPKDTQPQDTQLSLLDIKPSLLKKATDGWKLRHLRKAWRICDAIRRPSNKVAADLNHTDTQLEYLRKTAKSYTEKADNADSDKAWYKVAVKYYRMYMTQEYDTQNAALTSAIGTGTTNCAINDLKDNYIDKLFPGVFGDKELGIIGQDEVIKRRTRESMRSTLYYELAQGRQFRQIVQRFSYGALLCPGLSTHDLSYVLPKLLSWGAPPHRMEIEDIRFKDLKYHQNRPLSELFTLPEGAEIELANE